MTEHPRTAEPWGRGGRGEAAATAAKRRPGRGRAAPTRRRAPAASKIPAHLLERSKAAKAKKAGADADGGVTAPAGAATAVATAAPPVATGPAGHTQRLLTVVKSGSSRT